MSEETYTPHTDSPNPLKNWGFWAVVLGALALGVVFYQIFGPVHHAQPSAATTVGEVAGEIKRSAWRSFLGLKSPEVKPVPVPVTSVDYLKLIAPALGILAIVLSLISRVRGEHRLYPYYGVWLGVGAIVFQYVWWLALLIAGVMILIAIIQNIGDIFSF